jgi:type VI secretion system protein ImpC
MQTTLTSQQDQQATSADTSVAASALMLQDFADFYSLSNFSLEERLKFEIAAFAYCADKFTDHNTQFNVNLLDIFISDIDSAISNILDSILHCTEFQNSEALWCSLQHILSQANAQHNIKIDVLNISKSALRKDFQDNQLTDSLLFKTVYTYAYDMPGADPYGFMLLADYFSASKQDLDLLSNCAQVAKSSHCPILTAINSAFFHKDDSAAVTDIKDYEQHLQRPEYVHWQSFRKNPLSRYVNLTFPRFLLRMPYGDSNQIDLFAYSEKVDGEQPETLLWGNAAFAMASNMLQSFVRHGWMVNIRGPQSGGKVANLPVPLVKTAGLQVLLPPVEILIPESRELTLSEQGIIPLSYYVDTNFACFFSANSAHLAEKYDDDLATANSRANVRLPYLLLCSRLAHYLKVLQREQIGQAADSDILSKKLNKWLQTLVTKMSEPDADIMARFPLRDASVKVTPLADNPGYFSVALDIVPHFHLEGMAVRLSLVSRLPGDNKQ